MNLSFRLYTSIGKSVLVINENEDPIGSISLPIDRNEALLSIKHKLEELVTKSPEDNTVRKLTT